MLSQEVSRRTEVAPICSSSHRICLPRNHRELLMTTDTAELRSSAAVPGTNCDIGPATPEHNRSGSNALDLIKRDQVHETAPAPDSGSESKRPGGDPKRAVSTHEHKPTDDGPFSDVNGGLWAAITTVFCVLVGGGAHAVLLAAALGRASNGHISWWLTLLLCWLAPGAAVGIMVAGAVAGFRGFHKMRGTSKANVVTKGHVAWIGCAAGVFVLLVAGLLCTVAWMSNSGREVPFQPIVGASLAVIAFASFGGYFLASRRARVGLAASFVLTFFMLFTFLLTLEYLNQTASGDPGSHGVSVLSDFIKDFRGHVAIIVGFYFGTDAAVNIFKVWQSSKSTDPEVTVRADRDIASPRLVPTK
jgi:hypothetical protein